MSITFLNIARKSKKEWMAENERSIIVFQGEPGSLRTVAIIPPLSRDKSELIMSDRVRKGK